MKRIFALLFLLTLCIVPFSACGKISPSGKDDMLLPSAPEEEEAPSVPSLPLPETDEGLPEIPSDPIPAVSFQKREYLLVRADGLHVRSGAGTNFSSLGTVNKMELLAFCGEENGWCETRFRGKKAFVFAKYVTLTTLGGGDERVETVIAEGTRLLGVPYVYGATRFHDGAGTPLRGFSEDAFDCSSFMQYLFYRGAGVLLDMTTRTQVKQGVHVEKEEIRRGDLLFFTNASRKDKVGIERVGHVALYLGENYILHTASTFSKIEPLSETRKGYFLEARRLFGEP